MKTPSIYRKSVYFIASLSLVVIVLVFECYSRVYITRNMEKDLEAITNLAIVRGSIQRITKKELVLTPVETLVNEVDERVERHISDVTSDKNGNSRFNGQIAEFNKNWLRYKEIMYQYRSNPSEENKQIYLDISEKMWNDADEIVAQAQLISEVKLKYYNLFNYSAIFNILVIIVIIVFAKKYVHDKLEQMAVYDPLTKAYNRNYISIFLDNEIQLAEKKGYLFSLLMLDIDHFKNVNDSFGHAVGDYVLQQLTTIVKANIRKRDLLARVGGEEFVVLLPGVDVKEAETMAERLRKAVEEYRFEYVDRVTISLGVTGYSEGDSRELITKRSDLALYVAKNSGRNRVQVYAG